jgi:hypothetical protein
MTGLCGCIHQNKYRSRLVTIAMISKNCEIADHENCPALPYDCECSCHVRTLSSKELQVEKEKHGITRAEELRAETVP